jgi:hypothetical protein
VPPKPDRRSVHEVAGAVWRRPSVWLTGLGLLAGLPGLLAELKALPGVVVPAWVAHDMLIVGACAGFFAQWINSTQSADAAARVWEQLRGHLKTCPDRGERP